MSKNEKYKSAAARRKHEAKEYAAKKSVPKGYHRMPSGKLMKGSKHK